MELSTYQLAIIDWLKNGEGNACCNAVAGSGKSTTLRLAAQALHEAGVSPSDIKIIVFGKANAQDLITKFGRIWENSICTIHSAGYSLVKKELDIRNARRATVNTGKYKKIAQELELINHRVRGQTRQGRLQAQKAIAHDSDFIDILHKIRMINQEPTAENIDNLCFHFEITDVFKFDVVASAVRKCLREGEEQAINQWIFDFTDQIWLPVKWNVGDSPWFKPYKFVLVDECQDLNTTQLKLSLILAGQTGRMLFVGDPRQAIMGFAGADCDSYYKIVEQVKAVELPLSLCYRCPKSHIDLVNKIFTTIPIKAHPNAKKGVITVVEEKDLEEHLKADDLILSRKTNPLVILCIKLLAKGIPAKIKGKDIGKIIQQELEEIARIPDFDYERFSDFFEMYKQIKINRLEAMDNSEQLIENIKDRLSALYTIYSSRPEANSVSDLMESIDELFSDENSSIILSTCHRAKGLEANRVFILSPEHMPMRWKNQLDWQETQEDNLLYVALTRSKEELFIIRSEGVKDEDIDWFDFSEEDSEEFSEELITISLEEVSEEFSEELITISLEEVSEEFSEELITISSEEVSEEFSEDPIKYHTDNSSLLMAALIKNSIASKIDALGDNEKNTLRQALARFKRQSKA